MSKRLSQVIFSPIAILQLLILLILVMLTLLLTTPLGPAVIEKIARISFPPLELIGFHGTFLTTLKVDSLKWKDPTTTVELEQIEITKPRYDIAKNQLNSPFVKAKRLVIRLPKLDVTDTPSEKITSLPDFALPLNIDTESLSLASFEVIRENEVIFQIKDIVLSPLKIDQGKLSADAFDAQVIIAGSPLNVNLQNFIMNMNQPHEMQGRGSANFKQPQIGKINADFKLGGTIIAYEFKVKAHLETDYVSPQAIQLVGKGDYDQVIFSSLHTNSLDGNIKGNAEVHWTPELTWQVDANLQQVKLERYLPDWPATFDASLNYQGGYLGNSLYGTLDLQTLDGLLEEKKINATGKVEHKDALITLQNMLATVGKNTIKVNGKASPPFDLSWDLDANTLSQLLPDLSGKLVATGTLKGSMEQPLLNAKLDAKQIRYKQYRLQSADLIAIAKQGSYRLKGTLEQLVLDQQKISEASIDATGKINNHQLKLAFRHPEAKVILALKGGWKTPTWQGTLQKLQLDTTQVSKWKLQQAVQISASKDQITSSELCLSNRASAHTCSTLQWSALKGVDVKGHLKRTPLGLLNPFLPDDLLVKGNANGRYKIKQQDGKIVGDISLTLPKGSVSYGKGKHQQRLDYKSLKLNALIDGQNITATSKLLLKNKGELTTEVTIVLHKNGNPHQINVKGKLKRIPLLMATPWLPNDIRLKGNVEGTFKLKQQKGNAVGNVSLQFPPSSIIVGTGKQTQQIHYKSLALNALIDGKKVTATTQLILKNKGALTADAKLVLPSDNSALKISATGKLTRIPLLMAKPWLPKDIDLKGTVNGNFKLKQQQRKTVGDVSLQLPPSSVLLGKGKHQQQISYQSLTLKVLINGEKINVKTKLLLKNKGELDANANIVLARANRALQIDAKGKLRRIPLLMAKPWLPNDIRLNGSVDGNFKLTQKKGRAVGEVSLKLPASSVFIGTGKQQQRIDYQLLTLKGVMNGNKITANTKLVLKNKGELSADASMLLAKSGTPQNIKATGKLKRIPLAMAAPWLPREIQLKGSVNGRFKLKQNNGKLVGNVALKFPTSSLLVGSGKQRQQISYRSATLKAIIDGDKISAKTTLLLPNKATLTADATLRLANKKRSLQIDSKGKLTRIPLAMLQPWLPLALQLKGNANGQFKLKQANGKGRGEASLQLPANYVLVSTDGKTKQKIEYTSLTLRAIMNDNKITANTRLLLKNKGELNANATIHLAEKGSNHQIDIKGKLTRLPLAIAKPWLPDTLTLKGNMEGNFNLKQAHGKATGNLLLRLPNSHLVMMDAEGATTRFDYQNAFIKASINNKTVIANAKMQLNGRGSFSADTKIILGANNGANSKAHRIEGKAAVDIPNIRWMQNFLPQTTNLQGRVTSRVTFKGLLATPKITGQIALQNTSFKLPKVGTHLRQINISIKASDANRAIINGSLISGQGKLALSGFVSLQDLKKLNATIKLKGTNLQFINTHEAKAVMNPDITIKVTPKVVDITGKIHIPTATITLNAIPESSIDESEDVIVIGEKKADGSFSAIKIHPRLIVSLGKQVKFKGFGLDTKLGGSVNVSHDNQSILTQGSIKIDQGLYQAYGQNLTINDGRLVFNGPPTNIGMNVKAIRQIEEGDISVGIHLTGTLHNPKTALFSSPTLSESNILSYLLTGQSLGDITGSQTALLMQAVRSLNVTGGDGLVRNIGNSLGLDDLSIVPKDDLRKSELRLGKKLGSKLYVRYIVGIFDSMQKVALEYKVNKYLNLEAQVGREEGQNTQSLDLIYQVETN